MMSSSNSFAFSGSKIGRPEDSFPPINLHHKMDSGSRFGHILQNLAPEAILDPTNFNNISNYHDTFNLYAYDLAPNSLATTSSCGELIRDYHHQISCPSEVLNQLAAGGVRSNGSVGSSDCLLSATNTNRNTDSSVEDDGISSLFSCSRNVWGNVVSSSREGESASDSSCRSQISSDHLATQTSGQVQGRVDGSFRNIQSCKTVLKDSWTAQIPDSSTPQIQENKQISIKKRNFGETYLNHVPSHPFLDIINQSDYSKFQLVSANPEKPKKQKSEKCPVINFQQPNGLISSIGEPDSEAIAQMKEMIYRAAAFRPVNFSVDMVEKPRRKNVRISSDPQTVAARQRREKISDKIRVLQKLVPGGSKMDTASMLDEAANYLKFLRSLVKELEGLGQNGDMENFGATNFASSSMPFVFDPVSLQSNICLQNSKSVNH